MIALLAALLAPPSGRAEEARTILLAQSEEAGDEPSEDAPAATPQAGPPRPPPDVRVTRVRGRGLADIETDVPESVTQFDASAIEALGAQNIQDLATVTPNVEIRSGDATQANFFIRGVGLQDFESNATGAVAIYRDGVSFNAPPLQNALLFDVQDVEVLRGPQGTGLSRNASAGAIKVTSRKPTGDYGAELRVRTGRYDPDVEGAVHGWIQDYEGAVEVPLVPEALSTRVAFRWRDAGPFMRNGCGDAPPFEERDPRTSDNVSEVDICGERSILAWPANRGIVSPVPPGLDRKVGDEHRWAARGQLRLVPPETEMDWLLNVHGSRLDQPSTLGQAIGVRPVRGRPGVTGFGGATASGYWEPDLKEERERVCPPLGSCDSAETAAVERTLAEARPLDIRPYRGDYNRVGRTTLDTWGASLRGDVPLGDLRLVTTTAYDEYARTRDRDNDFTPDVLFEQIDRDDAWQVYQDVALSGELVAHPFRWEVGGSYFTEHLEFQAVNLTTIRNLFRRYEQDIESFTVHGKFSWDFLDVFTLDGGVRYNWEQKDFDFSQKTVIDSRSAQDATWQEPTGTLSLTYRIREDVSAYWKYSRGFKAGHFNASLGRGTARPPARPESVDAFETGLRGRWLDGRFSLGGALFYYMYQDYQVFLFSDNPGAPPTLEILNAEEAEVFGAEIDASLEPLAGWAPNVLDDLELSARFGWLESQFLDFQNTVIRRRVFQSIPFVVDFSGNPLINSPRFKLSGAVEWPLDFGRWGTLIPRYDFSWSDDVFFDANEGRGSPQIDGTLNLPEFGAGQPAFWLHNARLTYRAPTGNLEVSLWVRNITDEVYKTFAFDVSSFGGVVINITGRPRTFGLDFSVSF